MVRTCRDPDRLASGHACRRRTKPCQSGRIAVGAAAAGVPQDAARFFCFERLVGPLLERVVVGAAAGAVSIAAWAGVRRFRWLRMMAIDEAMNTVE